MEKILVLLSIRKNLVFEGTFLNHPFWSGPSVLGSAGFFLSCCGAKQHRVRAYWLHPTACAFAVHHRFWLPYKIRATHEVNYSLL